MTHDYKRNGTTTLFGALCTLTGCVISTCMKRHRQQEWIRFLTQIDQEVPAGLDEYILHHNKDRSILEDAVEHYRGDPEISSSMRSTLGALPQLESERKLCSDAGHGCLADWRRPSDADAECSGSEPAPGFPESLSAVIQATVGPCRRDVARTILEPA